MTPTHDNWYIFERTDYEPERVNADGWVIEDGVLLFYCNVEEKRIYLAAFNHWLSVQNEVQPEAGATDV